jgi:hypothetical protein
MIAAPNPPSATRAYLQLSGGCRVLKEDQAEGSRAGGRSISGFHSRLASPPIRRIQNDINENNHKGSRTRQLTGSDNV